MMMPKTDTASPATVAQRHRQRSWILRHGARLLTLVISMAGCLSIGTAALRREGIEAFEGRRVDSRIELARSDRRGSGDAAVDDDDLPSDGLGAASWQEPIDGSQPRTAGVNVSRAGIATGIAGSAARARRARSGADT